MNLEQTEANILQSGPSRVVINADGEAHNPQFAMHHFKIGVEVIFIRNDGWSLGAPKRFEDVAFLTWWDHWVARMDFVERSEEYPCGWKTTRFENQR